MKRTAIGLLLVLAGCTQVDALAPVGGDHISMVRIAANDILLNAQIDLLTAPVCTQDGDRNVCKGETLAGEAIGVESTGDHLSVKVGDRTLYDGSLASVIAENAQQK